MRVARRSWQEYYKGQSTTEWKLRGAALDDAIKKASPSTAMELGTYCGYSAIRIGRLLPPGGKLVSVEVDPLYAAIATKVLRPALSLRHASRSLATALPGADPLHCRQVVEHAGLGDSVKIEIGDLAEKFERIATKYSLGPRPCGRAPSWRCLSCRTLALELVLEAAGCVGRSRCEPLSSSGPDGGQAAIAAARPGRARRFRGVPHP